MTFTLERKDSNGTSRKQHAPYTLTVALETTTLIACCERGRRTGLNAAINLRFRFTICSI